VTQGTLKVEMKFAEGQKTMLEAFLTPKSKGARTKKQQKAEEEVATEPTVMLEQLQQECHDELVAHRDTVAARHDTQPATIFSDKTLLSMSKKMPKDAKSMYSCVGVTDNNFGQFGQSFLAITQKYAERKLTKRTTPARNSSQEAAPKSKFFKKGGKPLTEYAHKGKRTTVKNAPAKKPSLIKAVDMSKYQ
jgi:ribonuclease D